MGKAQETIAEGMYLSDRCQFCGDFGEKAESYLCSNCMKKIQELGYLKLPEGKPPLLSDDEIRANERQKIQQYIDANSIYQVEFGHYESPLNMKWISLKTHRINIMEVFHAKHTNPIEG